MVLPIFVFRVVHDLQPFFAEFCTELTQILKHYLHAREAFFELSKFQGIF